MINLKEPFATNLCQYLRRRCPGISNNALSTETFQIMFTALQTKANFLPAIANELNQLMSTIRNSQVMLFLSFFLFIHYKFR